MKLTVREETVANTQTAPVTQAPVGVQMTYEDLKKAGCATLEREGKTGQQLRNMLSGLNLWMKTFGLGPTTKVGAELTTDFNRHILLFSDAHRKRLKPRTQKDRQEQISLWERIYSVQKQEDVLPPGFFDALQVMFETSGLSMTAVASRIAYPSAHSRAGSGIKECPIRIHCLTSEH